MKSRITIEVDFENKNLPVIQILSRQSDDVRDGLIKSFLQSLQHTSRWAKFLYKGGYDESDQQQTHRWFITPLQPKDLRGEIDLMLAVLTAGETVKQNPTHRFGDNIGEPEYKEMIYQRSIQNPYPSDSPTNTAYDKGFTECWQTFSKAEQNPNLSKK